MDPPLFLRKVGTGSLVFETAIIGIWQDVRLRFTEGVVASDPQIISYLALPDTTSAKISVNTQVRNTTIIKQTINVTGSIENIRFSLVCNKIA